MSFNARLDTKLVSRYARLYSVAGDVKSLAQYVLVAKKNFKTPTE
jgi:hypothetical protein